MIKVSRLCKFRCFIHTENSYISVASAASTMMTAAIYIAPVI